MSWRRDLPLQGRVAVVTGAARGMGASTARLFAACGASVMLTDLDLEGETVAAEIRAEGNEARFMPGDIADEQAVEAIVAKTVQLYGRLDAAVNNAAITPDTRPVAEADFDEIDRILRVNLRGIFVCMKHELSAMILNGSGAIVNIGSISGVRPQAGTAAYGATKAGVISATKTAAVENARRGIRVNAVLPGAIDSPMMRERLVKRGLSEKEHAGRLSLFERFGRPEEIAEACLWLCSPASSFVTGHALAVDAGYLAR